LNIKTAWRFIFIMKKRRDLAKKLLEAANSGNCVILSGPRQSGKTFLVRECFPNFDYALLESPDTRLIAKDDPRGFLSQGNSDGLIIDEAQLVPELLSYLQEFIDAPDNRRKFILTRSQNFLLMESVTQSLAGRASLLTLLPFSQDELWERTGNQNRPIPQETTLDRSMISGFYPPIHDRCLNAIEWLAD
jgi:predicted AAA+ superfamily ATPase